MILPGSRPAAANSNIIGRAIVISGAPQTAAERYRCIHLVEQLSLLGIPCALVRYDYRHLYIPSGFEKADFVVIHRTAWDKNLSILIKNCRARRAIVVFDIDDLVFDKKFVRDLPVLKTMQPGELKTYFDGVQRYQKTLLRCDAALAPTKFLCDRIQERGIPSFVHRNALGIKELVISEEAFYGAPVTSKWEVNIAYFSGSNTHDRDFLMCSDGLLQVMKAHLNVKLIIGGRLNLDSRFEQLRSRIECLPMVNWDQLPSNIQRADINLAPLEVGVPYCEAKSELKYFEAGVLGIPTIASATEAYCHAIQHGVTGFIASSIGEWAELLRALVTNPQLRQEVGVAAQKDAYRRYSPARAANNLTSTLKEITAQFCRRTTHRHVFTN